MAANTQIYGKSDVVVSGALTEEQVVFYERTLLERLLDNLVFMQFGQKKSIPKNAGDKANFRRFESLTPKMTALTEGVTPDGNALDITAITAVVDQYGDYVTISDKIDTVGLDPVLTETAQLLGEEAALVIDTLVRDVIFGGTSVLYGGTKTSRYTLVATDKMTGDLVKKAVRQLKRSKIKKFNGYYIGLIDPDAAFDLMADTLWQDVSKYNGAENIMKGEIGKIHGVKFIDITNSKVYEAANLTADAANLSVKTAITEAADEIEVKEAISTAEATALAGRYVIIEGVQYTVESATAGAAGAAKVKLTENLTVAADKVIYPGEAGAAGVDVHATLILGKDAYGVVDVEGSAKPKMIYKPLGSGDDPLDQRATAAWKCMFTTVRLQELAMVRLETGVTA